MRDALGDSVNLIYIFFSLALLVVQFVLLLFQVDLLRVFNSAKCTRIRCESREKKIELFL